MPRYYVKDTDAVLRRRDGEELRDAPPDERLTPAGWRPLGNLPVMRAEDDWLAPPSAVAPEDRAPGPGPLLLLHVVEVSEREARSVARELGLPRQRWCVAPQ